MNFGDWHDFVLGYPIAFRSNPLAGFRIPSTRLGVNVQRQDVRPLRRLAIEVLLKWAGEVRREPATAPLIYVLWVAEANEKLATAGLRQIAAEQGLFSSQPSATPDAQDRADREALIRLSGQFVSPELRRRSRQCSLIREWQAFNNPEPWPKASVQFKPSFLTLSLDQPEYQLGIERWRARRLVDDAVRRTLKMLEAPPPSYDDPRTIALAQRWRALLSGPTDRWNRSPENERWMQAVGLPIDLPVFVAEHEEQIEELQRIAERLRRLADVAETATAAKCKSAIIPENA